MGFMIVDGGVSVNIMPLAIFKKLGREENDSKQMNLSLSGFAGEPGEAQAIVSKELTVGSKIVPTTFLMLNVKGWYNILLGCDWIHANECVPSTLHWCMIQWVGDHVEIIGADEAACVMVADS
jgi:hypothetical protein